MSKKVLLIESDLGLAAILDIVIRKKFDAEVICKTSATAAAEFLQRHHDFSCIIVDDDAPKGATNKMIKAVQQLDRSIPVIALVNPIATGFDGKFVYAKVTKPDVTTTIEQILKNFLDEHNKDENSIIGSILAPFFFIRLESIYYFNRLDVDFYIKLSEDKILKLFEAGSFFGKEDYDKYNGKGVEGLYALKDELPTLIDRLFQNYKALFDLNFYTCADNLVNLINAQEVYSDSETGQIIDKVAKSLLKAEENSLGYDEGVSVCKETLSTISKTIGKFGITPSTQNLTKATVLLSLAFIKKSPMLGGLLEKMQAISAETEDSYLVDHSLFLANLTCVIAGVMGWNSNLTYYKLTLASFIHDMPLKNPKLAKFRSLQELMSKCDIFSEEELQGYINHPYEAAKMIESFRMIPPDIASIVLEHHERPDGMGFPRKINYNSITPLGKLFIVSHDIVSYIFNKEKNQSALSSKNKEERPDKLNSNLITFLNQHRMLYQMGDFKHIFDAIWNNLVNTSNPKSSIL
ncbi:MAG: hypothetical protein HQK50_06020 [Oligoflexia bacterium]|nr:hypothetical protein [Oligoflexia bacterium]MBF0365107.1 hypothetical protein [Oligoflexia bacterium]